jgi:hypothetical protein
MQMMVPELFQSLRNISDQKPISDEQKDQLLKMGLIKQVFGGALLMTKDGQERLDNLNRIERSQKETW